MEKYFIDEFGVKFSQNKKRLVKCPADFIGTYVIPEGVTAIGNLAYEESSIGEEAFCCCTGLTSVVIPDSVKFIGGKAFYGCTGLASVVIPDSVEFIDDEAFYGCTGFTSIAIPNSVKSIGAGAFNCCSNLKHVYYNANVADSNFYDPPMFYNCPIKELVLGPKVPCIPGLMCRDQKELKSIEIPSGVTSIEQCAFVDSGLTSIVISDSVTNIVGNVLYGCTDLTSIVVDKNNPIYDSRENCNAIINSKSNFIEVGCKSTKIPSSVTSIGDGAFAGLNGLASIVIPSSVTYIGLGAFSDCMDLKYVTIPDGVKEMRSGIFKECKNLEQVYLPNTLSCLPAETFYGCEKLEELNIPKSVKRIGKYCICRCNSLKTLVIPEGVEVLNSGCINRCKNLEKVSLPSTISDIGQYVFSDCPNLKAIAIPSGSKAKFLQMGFFEEILVEE